MVLDKLTRIDILLRYYLIREGEGSPKYNYFFSLLLTLGNIVESYERWQEWPHKKLSYENQEDEKNDDIYFKKRPTEKLHHVINRELRLHYKNLNYLLHREAEKYVSKTTT